MNRQTKSEFEAYIIGRAKAEIKECQVKASGVDYYLISTIAGDAQFWAHEQYPDKAGIEDMQAVEHELCLHYGVDVSEIV